MSQAVIGLSRITQAAADARFVERDKSMGRVIDRILYRLKMRRGSLCTGL